MRIPASTIDRHVQYAWGNFRGRYIDDIILHREDSGGNGSYEDAWYHLSDVQFSTVAILNDIAEVQERVMTRTSASSDQERDV